MPDMPSVKDRYAKVIETALRNAHPTDYEQMSIDIVKALEGEGLMPIIEQFRLVPAFDDSIPEEQVEEITAKIYDVPSQIPALIEGDHLIRQYATAWSKA